MLICWMPLLLPAAFARGEEAGAPEFTPREPLGAVVVARPGSDEALGLQKCVEIAHAGNDNLKAERMRRQELDGKMYQALSTGLPTIDLTGEWLRSRDPSFALDETFGGDGGGLPAPLDTLFGDFQFLPAPEDIPAQTFWRGSVNLHWTINPVQVIGAVGAASLGRRRQNLAIVAAEHEVTEQTVTAYHGIILAAERLAAVEAEVANQEEFLAIMRMRHELGLATPLDTLQASVAVANTTPQLHRARHELRNAGARLNALMGREPHQPLAVRNEQLVETEPPDRERLLALAQQRPDLGQVQLMTDILRRNRQAQKADMRPYLSVDGAYGYVGRGLDDLTDKGHDFWRASVALNVPLFDGLLTKGLVGETEATIRRTESELAGMRRQVTVEVLELLDSLQTAQDNLRAARLNLTRSEDLLEQMTLMLRLGKADYLSVLEAEASRSQARSNLIEARYEVLTLSASLKRASGVSPLLSMTAINGLTREREME